MRKGLRVQSQKMTKVLFPRLQTGDQSTGCRGSRRKGTRVSADDWAQPSVIGDVPSRACDDAVSHPRRRSLLSQSATRPRTRVRQRYSSASATSLLVSHTEEARFFVPLSHILLPPSSAPSETPTSTARTSLLFLRRDNAARFPSPPLSFLLRLCADDRTALHNGMSTMPRERQPGNDNARRPMARRMASRKMRGGNVQHLSSPLRTPPNSCQPRSARAPTPSLSATGITPHPYLN